MRNRKPNRRLLEMRPKLGNQPKTLSRLRHRVRQKRHRRQKRPLLRSHGRGRRRPNQPPTGHPPPRRHPKRTLMDNLQTGHGNPAEKRTGDELVQNNRRTWDERTRGRWAMHKDPLRDKHNRTWDTHTRLQERGEW